MHIITARPLYLYQYYLQNDQRSIMEENPKNFPKNSHHLCLRSIPLAIVITFLLVAMTGDPLTLPLGAGDESIANAKRASSYFVPLTLLG
jgi:hypothetical protein